MWKVFKRPKELTLRLCERCGQVCDGASRCAAMRERVLLQELWLGVRI